MAKLTFHPLTPDRWQDFETLFGSQGAYGGCWCMWWRSKRSEWEQLQGDGNRHAMKKIVDSGEVPGILAYEGEQPVGWCSVAPRETYSSLGRSRVLKPLDERPVWSIVCFHIAKKHRGKGVMQRLIHAAVDYVRDRGGELIEAYPTDPQGRRLAPVSSFMGTPQAFERAGFRECARPSKVRVVMRRGMRPRRP